MEIKEQLQKFFDKEICYISKKGNLYYVVLVGPEFIKPIYKTDINGENIIETSLPLLALEKMKLVYTKFKNK